MKIAAIGCIHNEIERLPILFEKVASYEPDILISVGDIADASFPKGFEPIDIGKIFLEEAKEYFKKVLIVPGTWDKDLISFFQKQNVLIHGRGESIGDVGIYGFGGAQTPFNTPYEPSDKEIEEGLRKAFNEIKDKKIKIQATHAPPFNSTLDLVGNKHVGSLAVRKIIEEFSPQVAICAHIHESVGKDFIKNSLVINVGKFTEGYFGLIEIKNDSINAEIVSLI
jgi:Icc-related predicted phosphoesterase